MGRQSARLLNNKKDHKNIFFNGHYHKQMWITDKNANPTLLWEKLVSRKVFTFTVRDTMTSTAGVTPSPGKILMNIVTPYNATPMVIDWGDGTTETTKGSTYFFHEFPTSDNSLYTVNIYYESLADFAGSIFYSGNYVSAIEEILTPLPVFEGKIGQTEVTLGAMFSSCKSLKKVCSGFFDNYIDYGILINAVGMFGNSGIEQIPEEFTRNVKIYMANMFYNCESLTYIDPSAFSNSEIDVRCFSVFQNCTALKELPAFLFISSNEMNFSNLFRECTNLSFVPTSFFDACPNILSVSYAFYRCTNITSKVPELWERDNISYYEDCYNACYKAENYAEIPSSWK